METIKTIKLPKGKSAEKLNAAEQGKLWASYMGNTMSICTLSYILTHLQDNDIRAVMENALGLSKQIVQHIKVIFNNEGFPIPTGFTEKDVNVNAPRLFADDLYLHYLKYLGKAGISLYGIAVPLMTRTDVRSFFTQVMEQTILIINQANEVLIAKGLLSKPPQVPYPTEVKFIHKQSYLNGFFGDIRPLQAMEITHLYDCIDDNAISKAVLIGFSQVAQEKQCVDYFLRGKKIANKHYDIISKVLESEDLSAQPVLDPLVTASTIPPFSDKLLMFHKLDMFSMRIRAYANAISLCARHDLVEKLSRMTVEVGNYVEDGANIMIDNGWLEQPPHTIDRKSLVAR
jgi:hypothetical protein